MLSIFKKKGSKEQKLSEIKKLKTQFNLKDLNEVEEETFYYMMMNFNNSKNSKIEKKDLENLKHIAKLMSEEEISNDEIVIAQNFMIMDLLMTIVRKMK